VPPFALWLIARVARAMEERFGEELKNKKAKNLSFKHLPEC
jgi:hypothetical protein